MKQIQRQAPLLRVVRGTTFVLTAILIAQSGDTHTNAAILFESGTLGPTGVSWQDALDGLVPGSSVAGDVFSGVRFQLMHPVVTTQIGGHFFSPAGGDFFGAIIQLENENDSPNSGDLSTPDVLGTTLLTFPVDSAETFADLNLHLNTGWYALVYGSGLFGASGEGGMVLNNPDIGHPAYIAFQPLSGVGWIDLNLLHPIFRNFRFVIQGRVVPEPEAASLMATAFLALLFLQTIRPTSRPQPS